MFMRLALASSLSLPVLRSSLRVVVLRCALLPSHVSRPALARPALVLVLVLCMACSLSCLIAPDIDLHLSLAYLALPWHCLSCH